MGAEVTKRVQGTPLAKKLDVILGDVIKMPQMPPCDALISNTPYQISSPLIFKMLSMPNPPRVAVLMVRVPPVCCCDTCRPLADQRPSSNASSPSGSSRGLAMPSTRG